MIGIIPSDKEELFAIEVSLERLNCKIEQVEIERRQHELRLLETG